MLRIANDRMRSEAPLAARYAWRSCGTRRTLDEALFTATIGHAQRSCAEHHPRPGQAAMRSIALRTRQTLRSNVRGMTACSPPFSCGVRQGRAKPLHSQANAWAQVIANTTKSHFETLSTVLAGKADLREVIEKAQERRKLYGTRTILFVKDDRETLNWA